MTNKKNKRKRDPISVSVKGDVFLAMAPHLSPIDLDGSNVVFSPLSLRAMLSLIAAGASGPAAEQLLSFLKSDSIDDVNKLSSKLVSAVLTKTSHAGGPKICFANGVWIHEGFSLKRSFKQVVDNVYKADLRQVDFITNAKEIVSEVNSWAREKTNGLIRDILPPGSVAKAHRLILANALYFKGAWSRNCFTKSSTKDYDFHLLGGNSAKVPFMTSNHSSHSIRTYHDFKVLGLPYKQGNDKNQFSMYILLPNLVDGLTSLAERVVSEPHFLDRHLSINDSVSVSTLRIPKFKISYGFSASKTIKQLGITLPFKAGGLTRMAHSAEEGDELFVSEIYQKAFIEVNEEGTTAAAVTRSGLIGCPRRRRPVIPKVDFVADHPFIFLIREEVSGVVLFFGHVLNPLKE